MNLDMLLVPLILNVSGEVDLMMISETNIDDSFPLSQCLIKGCSNPFHIDRYTYGRGILLYAREEISVKLLSIEPITTA